MDTNAKALVVLLDILEAEGILGAKQTQTIRIRQGAIRSAIMSEKRAAGRYEVNPVEILMASGVRNVHGQPLDEEAIVAIWAKANDMPYLHIDPLKLNAKLITETFSQAFSRNNVILPVSLSGQTLTVACDTPQTESLARSLRETLRYVPSFVLSSKTAILRSISEVYGFRSSVRAAASEQGTGTSQAQMALGNLEQFIAIRQLEDIDASDSHVINAVDYLLNYAFAQRASDIHIEPRRTQSVVRLRIDGVLHESHRLPGVVHAPLVSRFKMMGRMDIAEKRRPQDGRIKTEFNGREVELRLSTMPVAFGEKIVIRIFDAGKLFQDIETLGMTETELSQFKHMLAARTGLILVTGPTGSGKTTTLYSALQTLSSPRVNITAIEDPIEMVSEQFNQVQVQPKIGLDFQQALRTVLRQDPDVIMVGEIRDRETAHMTVQAALTGHLVISTLHTNDAPSGITRMLDLGVQPFLLSSCLLGTLAQRLARVICTHCKTPRTMTEDEMTLLGIRQSSAQRRVLNVQQGTGCTACRKTGMYGQTGLFEVLEISPTLRRLIHEAASREQLAAVARADGMNTLLESALQKLGAGVLCVSEVVRVLGLDLES